MSKKSWYLLFAAAVVLLFFGNSTMLVTDSVECNYALTAKEMALGGDWISPKIFGGYYFDKPVMTYWLMAIMYKIFGLTDFASRCAQSLFGLASIGLICYAGTKLYNEKTGFYAGLMLLSCVEFFLISKSVITDIVLFFFFSATLLFFYLGYRDNKKLYWYLMYASSALAVLTKGPVGLALPGLIILLFMIANRDWRVVTRCHMVTGFMLFFAVCAPWYYAMWAIHGNTFIAMFLGIHNVLRATVSEHPRDNVIWYYTAVNTLALFPWTALAPVIAVKKWFNGERRPAEKQMFLLIWTFTIFFFFQNMATKYITYTFPLLFPAFILLAHYVEEEEELLRSKVSFGFVVVIYGILLGAAYWFSKNGDFPSNDLWMIPVATVIGIALHFVCFKKQKSLAFSIATFSIIFYLSLIQSIALPLGVYRSGKDIADLLIKNKVTEAGYFGDYSTSAVYYSGTRLVKLISPEDMKTFGPNGGAWNSKDVMPFDNYTTAKYKYVLVYTKRLNNWKKIQPGNWKVLGATRTTTLLERK